jgi:hypothetical protein
MTFFTTNIKQNLTTEIMQTIIKIKTPESDFQFRFKVFYGPWQRKRGSKFVDLMAENGIECEII